MLLKSIQAGLKSKYSSNLIKNAAQNSQILNRILLFIEPNR